MILGNIFIRLYFFLDDIAEHINWAYMISDIEPLSHKDDRVI